MQKNKAKGVLEFLCTSPVLAILCKRQAAVWRPARQAINKKEGKQRRLEGRESRVAMLEVNVVAEARHSGHSAHGWVGVDGQWQQVDMVVHDGPKQVACISAAHIDMSWKKLWAAAAKLKATTYRLNMPGLRILYASPARRSSPVAWVAARA